MMSFLIFIFIMLTPFSYAEIFGIRVLFFQVFIGLAVVFLGLLKKNKLSIKFDSSMFLLLLFWILQLSYSFYTEVYDELYALSVFTLLLFSVVNFEKNFKKNLVIFYILAAFVTAFGIILQVVLHNLFGVQLFRYQLFGGNRNAYSFLWQDYSFISLYLASTIPLLWQRKFNFKFIVSSLILLAASVMTSARTGAAAFILFIFFYISFEIVKAIKLGRIKKNITLIIVAAFIIPIFLILGLENLTGRQVTTSSSGRFDDFVLGYHFLIDNFWFGALFNKEFYAQVVSAVPHNVFFYMIMMGGFFAFTIFLVWFLVVILKLIKADKGVLAALAICLIGFQFIPSFFSAYFLAVLLGIAFVSTRPNKQTLLKVH